MSNFTPATRQNVKPLIAFYGESGTGKTMSALLLARGIAGPKGRVGIADSESGRGSLYADVIPGGYDAMEIAAPFSSAHYVQVIDDAEAAGIDVLVVDSCSHEWEGQGGVLDAAGENEQRSGKPGLHCWKTPKLEHAKFVQRLLRSKMPIIVCLRAKYKSRQVKNDRGKTEIVKDDHTSPIQAEDFIFEATCHAEVMPDHSIHLTKCSHPDLRECFPSKGPITIAHGEAIAAWAASGGGPRPQAAPDLKKLKAELWNLGKPKFETVDKFEAWLREQGLLGEDESLSGLTADRLADMIPKVEPALF